MTNPAVHRLILNEIDRMEQETVELSGFQEKFHQADKDKAVLEEKSAPEDIV